MDLYVEVVTSSVLISTMNFLRRGSGKLFADQRVMFGLLVMPTRNAGEFVRVGLWYSVAKGLGGRRLWEDVQPQIIRLV